MKDETKAMKTLLFGLLATTRLRIGDAFGKLCHFYLTFNT